MWGFAVCILTAVLSYPMTSSASTSPPNVILIMADDLGIGDVGCFGNDTIRTPNIDRIASEGVKLTHHLAASSMCTPSRAAFMTGRYPIRLGMAPHGVFRVFFTLSSSGGLQPNETTIGEIAKDAGYSTGYIGKWHLGLNKDKYGDFTYHPGNQGFDYFYGNPLTNLREFAKSRRTSMSSSHPNIGNFQVGLVVSGVIFALVLKKKGFVGTPGFMFLVLLAVLPVLAIQYIVFTMRYLSGIVMRNFEILEQPIELDGFSLRLAHEGEQFIERRHKDQKPFLLMLAWMQVHTALHATDKFRGKSAHGSYGDEVEEMDWCVGQILKALDKYNLADNTFVYFTSDQGGHIEEASLEGEREGGYNGIYRGGKTQAAMDGGIRVPTVARWPGVIPAGSSVDVPTSLMDVLPTVANMVQGEVPKDRQIDGKNILPLLKGEKTVEAPHKFLVHYCGNLIHGARYSPGDGSDVYKIHLATPNWYPGTEGCGFVCGCYGSAVTWHDPPLMYNIAKDPSETQLLDTSDTDNSKILRTMLALLEEHTNGIAPVESQFEYIKMVPWPSLHPCCNFPSCTCKESEKKVDGV